MKRYFSLVKFSHTIFAMPFAMVGFFLAVRSLHRTNYSINNLTIKFVLVLICMVTARNAAMAFNRYLDRNFDAKNQRTALREIPQGVIAPKSSLVFTIINCVLFLVATRGINAICFYLAPVALAVILFYSYTKRFTAMCHIVLGIGLSLSPIGAYLAVTGVFNVLPLLFSLTVLFWVSGFDIIYALQDVAFDASQRLHSIPVALGKKNALLISRVLHACSAVTIIAAGYYGAFNWLYGIATVLFIALLMYQHTLVAPNNLSNVNVAFATMNGLASLVFGTIVIISLFI